MTGVVDPRSVSILMDWKKMTRDLLHDQRRSRTATPRRAGRQPPGGPAFYAYSTNYLVDTDAGIIVDVEATPAHRTLEVQSTRTMIERIEDRFSIKVGKLIGDTAYGSAEFLGWMVNEKSIEPHVPVWEKGERTDGTFSRSDFDFDEAADHYSCPNGKQLVRYRRPFKQARSGITKAGIINYRSDRHDCQDVSIEATVLCQYALPKSNQKRSRSGSGCGPRGGKNPGLPAQPTPT